MKTYFSEIIPKLQNYSHKLDEIALLANQHWILFDENSEQKIVYIFRDNNELIISTNGSVEKGSWDYLGNNSLLIEQSENSILFNHGFFNEKVLFLKVDGKNEYVILINEYKIQKEIKSLNEIYSLLKSKNEIKKTKNEESDNTLYLVLFFLVIIIVTIIISLKLR